METSPASAADPAGYALGYDEPKPAVEEQERVRWRVPVTHHHGGLGSTRDQAGIGDMAEECAGVGATSSFCPSASAASAPSWPLDEERVCAAVDDREHVAGLVRLGVPVAA
jgi:hypothetical protein